MHRAGVALLAVASFLGGGAAHGQDAWAGYDTKKAISLTGVIRDSGYDNTRSFINLETTNDTATRAEIWHILLAPPAEMASKGVSQEMIELGNFVTVVGYPSSNNPNELRAERIVIGNKTIDLR